MRYLWWIPILFIAWVIASIAIRIIGTVFFGVSNSHQSFAVVSVMAAIAVAIWAWRGCPLPEDKTKPWHPTE
jgi:hypothetical protein